MRFLTIRELWTEERQRTCSAPAAVRDAVARGLQAAEREGRLLSVATRRRARDIAADVPVPRSAVETIADFHAELEKSGARDEVAWLLHGGAAGARWSAEVLAATNGPDLQKSDAAAEVDPDPPREHRVLRRRLSLLIGAHGEEGAPLTAFREHVVRHGHKAVHRALMDLGAEHRGGRVVVGKRRVAARTEENAKRRRTPKSDEVSKSQAWRPFRFRGAK